MTRFNKILVPLDYSAHSDEAMRTAVDLASHYGASITLVNVYEPIDRMLPEVAWVLTPEQQSRLLTALTERLERSKKQARDLGATGVDSQLLEGEPAPRIVNYASEGGFDLIVMG